MLRKIRRLRHRSRRARSPGNATFSLLRLNDHLLRDIGLSRETALLQTLQRQVASSVLRHLARLWPPRR